MRGFGTCGSNSSQVASRHVLRSPRQRRCFSLGQRAALLESRPNRPRPRPPRCARRGSRARPCNVRRLLSATTLPPRRLATPPQSEVQAQVVLRVVARAARDSADLHRDPGADGRAVRSPAHALDGEPAALGRHLVPQQRRRIVDMVHHDIHATVIIEIAAGAAAPALGRGDAGPAWSETSRKRAPPRLRYWTFRCLDVQRNRLPSKRSPSSHPRHIQASGEWHAQSVWRAKRSAASMGRVPLPGGCRMSRESVQAVAGSDGAPVIDSAAASKSGDVEERGRFTNQRQHRAVRRCHPQSASSLAARGEQVMTAALRDCGRNDRQYRTSARVRNIPRVVGNHPRLAARVLGAECREKSGKGVSAG